MRFEMRRAGLFTAMVLGLIPAALAQEDAGARVSFSVTRFDPGDRPSPKFMVGGAGKRVEVEVAMTDIMGPFKATLRDDRFLDFFEGAAEKPTLSVDVPVAMRKDLLLVFAPTKDGTFNVMKVHAPKTRIKGGDRFIVNATQGDLALKLGDAKPILVKAAGVGLLSGPGGSKLTTLPVVIKQKTGEEWKLVSSEYWTCDPRFRSFLFVYRSPRTKHITFHGVVERLDMVEE